MYTLNTDNENAKQKNQKKGGRKGKLQKDEHFLFPLFC